MQDEDPPPVKHRLKTLPPAPGQAGERTIAHDVHAMLKDNLKKEGVLEINRELKPVPKKTRRKRDFIILIIGGNVVLPLLAAFLGMGVVSVVSAGAGIIIWNVGITWVMFQVMDDY